MGRYKNEFVQDQTNSSMAMRRLEVRSRWMRWLNHICCMLLAHSTVVTIGHERRRIELRMTERDEFMLVRFYYYCLACDRSFWVRWWLQSSSGVEMEDIRDYLAQPPY